MIDHKRIFVTGISTEVGKTVVSAIITEALKADYWKPVQAGDLDHSDSDRVTELISNSKSVVHKNSYALKTPMSPHAAAEREGIRIDLSGIIVPEVANHLVIEGAGGLLVPLNEKDIIADLIKPGYKVVLVSRHYLGSINHTLLSIEYLRRSNYEPHLIFVGQENPETENIILKKTGVQSLGRIAVESVVDKEFVLKYARMLQQNLIRI